MYQIFRTGGFKKDYKKLSNTDKDLLKEVATNLAFGNKLDIKYKDHKLPTNLWSLYLISSLLPKAKLVTTSFKRSLSVFDSFL